MSAKINTSNEKSLLERESLKDTKRKLLSETVARIDKQYGRGSVMFLGQKREDYQIESISTGSILLDKAIGIGGVPRGRVIEIFGPEASGKTTIALQIIAEAQKAGLTAAFIDAEHALDVNYAENLGVKFDELLLSQPDFGEQALDIAETLIRSGAVDVIVIDSVAALVPKAELEGEMGDTHIGLQARLMSQALRKLSPIVHKSKATIVFINQLRQNISSMPFMPKEVTSGGNALKFYASVRLDVRRIESLKDKENVHYGNKICIKVVKNKVSLPFKSVQVHLIFGSGISKYYEIVDLSISSGIIEQSGSWFSMNNEKLCQGKDSLVNLLKKDSVLFENLEKLVRNHLTKSIVEIDPIKEEVI